MKILYYSPHPLLNLSASTGYGTHMRETIAAFEKLGHTVLPVIMGGTDAAIPVSGGSSQGTGKGLVKKLVPRLIWRSLKDIRVIRLDRQFEKELLSKVQAFNPDLLYERAAYLQLSGVNVARQHNIPQVIEVNAPFCEENEKFEGGGSFFASRAAAVERAQLNNSRKVVVVSSALKEYLSEKYNIGGEKFLVQPNCINPEEVKIDHTLSQQLREKYKIKKEDTVVGFVGSIFPYHGVDLLIRSFAEIAASKENVKLLIVGDGLILDELRQLAREFKAKVIFTGGVSHSEVYTYIDLMDITVMARSNWYGSPVKIFEYGAMGKAIIAPDTVPVRDVMIDGEDGLLVEPVVSLISSALSRLISDKEERSRFGRNFQRKVLEKYTWMRNARTALEGL